MTADPLVLVSHRILDRSGPVVAEEIRDRLPAVELHVATADDETLSVAPEVEVLVTHRLTQEFLDVADSLRWVQALSAGIDSYDLEALEACDIVLTNVSGVHAKPIGQQVLGYLLYFERRFDRAVTQQHRGEWERYTAGELGDRTVSILGVGAIGSQVARYLDAFDARVLGIKRDPTTKPDTLDAVYTPKSLFDVLEETDYLVVACPLTDETDGLIDAEALSLLPDDAVVVNIARGEVLDEAALVTALEADELRGAALDVFETEPLLEGSPLWELENVLVTPHMAGSTPHYWARCADIFAENYRRFVDDEPLRNRII